MKRCHYFSCLSLTLFITSLTGCDKHMVPELLPRYVLTTRAISESAEFSEFAGTVQPYITSPLSFQTDGKVVSRSVDVGDKVDAGEIIAALDPSVSIFSLQSAQANLQDTQATLQNAHITAQRQRSLVESHAISLQDLDEAQSKFRVAQATGWESEARLRKAHEQLKYTQLKAGFAGVVTSVSVDKGQTVVAGQTVLQIAKPEDRDVVIDMPAGEISKVAIGDKYQVFLQSDPLITWTGAVREIRPEADATTRLWRVKIAINQAPAAFRFGTAVRTSCPKNNHSNDPLIIPVTAVLRRHQASFVWIVNPATLTVSLRNVQLLPSSRLDKVQVASGLEYGEEIVTAGVSSLIPGEKIRIYRSAMQ